MAMKMTMHIDEDLLAEVMETFAIETKTDAVHFALNELVRKKKLKKLLSGGMGFSPEELMDSVEPGYDPDALRVAESPVAYGPRSSD